MRKPPETSPQDVTPQEQDDIITQVREYKLITPLFGGGVTAGEGDPVTLIRGTEIRGLLRFWWRACRGGNYKTVEEMKKAEDKIWGAANKKPAENKGANEKNEETFLQEKPKGTVQLVVKPQRDDVPPTPYSSNIAPLYAAFPLQANRRENRPLKNVYRDVSFTLIISFPKAFRQEVEAALWAWETFGGIGARTRRGFGALRGISIKENEESVPVNLSDASEKGVKEWLDTNLETHMSKGPCRVNIPHLPMSFKEGENLKLLFIEENYSEKADDLWYDLIEALKRFRQTRYASTRPNAKNPGRSMWSEPSTIRDRDYTHQSYLYHRKPIPDPPIKKFPRAAFGLPIIFQFKDSNKEKPPRPNDPESDPRKTVLELKEHERFASPLILKPLACQDNDTVGLAIILEGTSLGSQQLVLKTQEGKQDQWNVEAFLASGETLELRDEKGKKIKLDSKTDILQAFIKYL
jgi:CRISPR-associated protein Cmr1